MKYPSQYEAQLILDTMEALDDIHTGYASDTKTKRIIENAHEEVRQEFQRVFNNPDYSPWEVTVKVRGNKRRRFIQWRKNWDFEKQD